MIQRKITSVEGTLLCMNSISLTALRGGPMIKFCCALSFKNTQGERCKGNVVN